jgi:short-subunit dehydrogenase
MKIIRGRKALIAAADCALGRSIALALAAQGADLYLIGRNANDLDTTARLATTSGVKVVTAACDLVQPAQLAAVVGAVMARWDCVHILVNNAEELHYGPTHNMAAPEWDRVLSANLLTPIELVRAFLPTLALQDEAHVLNICSVFGLVATRNMAAFQTGHFGLLGLTTALRAEYTRKGFGITALCPSMMRTGLQREAWHLPEWMHANPDEVGRQAIRAIRRNRAIHFVPGMARLYWWAARVSPALGDRIISGSWRGQPGRKAARVSQLEPQSDCFVTHSCANGDEAEKPGQRFHRDERVVKHQVG